jgi:hypothetical protein
LLKYFKKDFTNNFLRFLESNKTITGFKNFQYSEIIKIDQVYITSFEDYYKIKLEEQNNIPLSSGNITPVKMIESSKVVGSEGNLL